MTYIRRVLRIIWTIARFRLDEVARSAVPESRLIRLSPFVLLGRPKRSPAERLRLAIEDLGPIFVKFGQILSTRRDLLPTDYADELARLQDRVPPFPAETAIARIEASIGSPIGEVFATFDEVPIASASLAQVHAATLADSAEVVVKVLRPGIESIIEKDLELLYAIAALLERFSRDARRLRLKAVVADYERTVFDELNLLLEAANTATLRRNFADSPLLYAPRVHWEHCREDVFVVERVEGVPIADVAELRARGTDMRKLAARGVETFFTQVFEHNFFHADMHPGNIFIDVSDPANPSYIAVDCAVIGRLTEQDQAYLAKNLVAFFHQDYARVARLHVESGWVPPGTDVSAFEAVIRQLCEPIFERPLKEISFGNFLVALFRAARRFDMEVQPQLVLLQKTLLNIEGLGRQLYPDLDLWATAKPYMERWIEARYGPLAALRRLGDRLPDLLDELPRLPDLLLGAEARFKDLDRLAAQQRELIAEATEALGTRRRHNRWRRIAGLILALAGLVLLWKPLLAGDGFAAPAVGVAALVIGALFVTRN
ncbi:MAG: ubiquinone biosynthesis regulatory protein kinase UbiB [Gammaproteobacteria bacterium]|nr:ubiquinone biosynthesis regulatory protein kinase UbiB [Gammaproteobacteria bacterium]MDE0223583.1 ubiquinone biosynthesis regulatory protein kinase UbiB [Gammaproteobacteria bacterium]